MFGPGSAGAEQWSQYPATQTVQCGSNNVVTTGFVSAGSVNATASLTANTNLAITHDATNGGRIMTANMTNLRLGTNNTANAIQISASGNVGIGKVPTIALDVNGQVSCTEVSTSSNANISGSAYITGDASISGNFETTNIQDNGASNLLVFNKRKGALGGNTLNGYNLGRIDFNGWNTESKVGAQILARQEGTATTGVPCGLQFYTSSGASPIERMTISKDGAVNVAGSLLLNSPNTALPTLPNYRQVVNGSVYAQGYIPYMSNSRTGFLTVGADTNQAPGNNGTTYAWHMYGQNAGGAGGIDFHIASQEYEPASYGVNGPITNRLTINPGGAVSIPASLTVGTLSKSSGTFKIDHPLKPDTHHLVHSFIEAPKADLNYRGVVTLVAGRAVVNIDAVAGMTEGTFVALCRDVQCFTTNESDWFQVRGRVEGNILTIEAQDPTATSSVSWLVIGERKDKHMYETDWTDDDGRVIVEPLKKS